MEERQQSGTVLAVSKVLEFAEPQSIVRILQACALRIKQLGYYNEVQEYMRQTTITDVKKILEYVLSDRTDPVCRHCSKPARLIKEYNIQLTIENEDSVVYKDQADFVREGDGTYNPHSDTMICTECFIKMEIM